MDLAMQIQEMASHLDDRKKISHRNNRKFIAGW